MADECKPELFLLDQKLFRLKPGLSADKPFSAEERKHHACGTHFEEEAWEAEVRLTRPDRKDEKESIVNRAQGPAPWQRVALVCDAGLGKTTNMQFMQAQLAQLGSRQLPVLIRLDTNIPEETHCGGVDLFKEELAAPEDRPILNWLAKELFTSGADGDKSRYLAAFKRLQAQGRITLLIDGLDHAISEKDIANNLKQFLGSEHWCQCPIWIAGRPTAFEARWRDLFCKDHWQFLRVAPLGEAEIRFYMTQRTGNDWYSAFPGGGRPLLAIPRFLRLICGIIRGAIAGKKTDAARRRAVKALKLNTPADVYCMAYLEVGDEGDTHPDPNSLGLLAQGLKNEAAQIGLKSNEVPLAGNRIKRVARAAALLGALAFEMYHPSNRRKPAPRFNGAARYPFQEEAAGRFQTAGVADTATFDRELELLLTMDIHTLDFLLFKKANEKRLAFRDRTTMAFFAAYWACHHAQIDTCPSELEVTRHWVVDDLFEKNREYREFWQFAAEMPDSKCFRVDESRWLQLFTPLYDGSVQDKKKRPIRSAEFIYRSWPRMAASAAGRKIIREKYRIQTIPHELLNGFIPLVRNVLPQDNGEFNLGVEDRKNPVKLAHFCLHKFCVTNLEYELFDPRHQEKRLYGKQHPAVEKLDDKTADNSCPVVMVSWYDAVCYARWLGSFEDEEGSKYVMVLPREEQWEYACRAGRPTRFTFDEAHPGDTCTPEYCNYNGNYPEGGNEKGENRQCSVPVNGLIPTAWLPLGITPVKGRNRWGIYQMHGNVWEWCDSWYGTGASLRVLRGGSWLNSARNCRSANRDWNEPDFRHHYYGFRLAAVPGGAK